MKGKDRIAKPGSFFRAGGFLTLAALVAACSSAAPDGGAAERGSAAGSRSVLLGTPHGASEVSSARDLHGSLLPPVSTNGAGDGTVHPDTIGSCKSGGADSNCCFSAQAPSSFGGPLGSGRSALFSCSSSTCANSSDSASNHGTGSVANATVELIFWGSQWPNATPSPSQVTQAIKTLMATNYFTGLAQYGLSSVRLDQVVTNLASDPNGYDPPSSFDTDDVEGFLEQEKVDGYLPKDPNGFDTIYLVMMPPGVSPKQSNVCGSNEQSGFSAAYVAFTDLDSMTMTASHELVEAITDASSTGWRMDRYLNNDGYELGDACTGMGNYINGFAGGPPILVQSYWSNNDRSCILPYPDPPTVSNISPFEGAPGGGYAIGISGTNFVPGLTKVSFGSKPSPSVTCTSSTACTATVPPGDGIVPVTVSVYGMQTTSPTDFYYSPSVLSVSPQSGFAGNTVNLTGVNVCPSSIYFGSSPATIVSCNVDQSVTVTVPPPTGGLVVNVVAKLNGVSSTPTNANLFTYGAMAITGLNFTHGGVTGGTLVTIQGTGFDPCPGTMDTTNTSMQVWFGNKLASEVICSGATQVGAVSPAAANGPGPVDVTVTWFGHTTPISPADVFTYTALGSMDPQGILTYWSGNSLTGVVAIDSYAPAGGAAVAITSSNPSSVATPSTVVIPAGATDVTFAIKTPSPTTARATLTATYGGTSATTTVTPAAPTSCPTGESVCPATNTCLTPAMCSKASGGGGTCKPGTCS